MNNIYPTPLDEIKYIKKKYGFETAKKLGQNFITNREVVSDIVSGSEAINSIVIEIGPGIGTLTALLAKEARAVIAIELDDRLIPILEERFSSYDNVKIIHSDVLEIDLNKVIEEATKEFGKSEVKSEVKIIGNLPYYITTPIIVSLLKGKIPVESITIMIQKEVADRIIAEPGSKKCGAITYLAHYYSKPRLICEVDKGNFYPMPKVDSAVIKLDIREKPAISVANEELFFKIIKAGFMQRRKTLVNSISHGGQFDKGEIIKALEALGIDLRRRAETLSLLEFARLSTILAEEKHNG